MFVRVRDIVRMTMLLLVGLVLSGSIPLLGSPVLQAQGTDATITGRVTDTTGTAMAGVDVIVRNASTGYIGRGVTRADGRFLFPQLPLGTDYTVTVRRIGYQAQVRQALALTLGDRLDLAFRMKPSTANLDPVVITDNAGTGTGARRERLGASTKVSAREIEELPVQNRNFTDLALLAPTTSGSGFNIGGAKGEQQLCRVWRAKRESDGVWPLS